jgi:hypothetical protein
MYPNHRWWSDPIYPSAGFLPGIIIATFWITHSNRLRIFRIRNIGNIDKSMDESRHNPKFLQSRHSHLQHMIV